MMNVKNFEQYTPETPAFGLGVLYLCDETGRDWYEMQKEFGDHTKTMKVVYDEQGVIWSINRDVSMLQPIGRSVGEVALEHVPEGFNDEGEWMYKGGKLVPRVYTPEELKARADKQKERLLDDIARKTQAWHTQLILGMISDEDKASLIEWMKYTQAVQAVDTSNPDVVWPKEPQPI